MPQFVGKTARELYAAAHPEFFAKFQTCFETHTPQTYSAPYRMTSTGKDKFIQVTLGYVPPDSVLLITEDITERVHAETELH